MWIRVDKLALVISGAIILAGTGVALADTLSGLAATSANANSSPAPVFKQPTNLTALLALPLSDLDKVDAGLINILCAEGLPGSEGLNVAKCLDALDLWAQRVKIETQRHFYRFAEHPELFCHSLAYYQMQMLGDVLVNDLRMRYDPQRVEASKRGLRSPNAVAAFFMDSKDIFLSGLLDGDHYGTCASMPFLYVAVGRRLGYPVNLAATEEHLYARCEDANGEHLNVEATAVSRFKTPPDEYYRDMVTAPDRDAEIAQAGWLRPLSNREIVGHSLVARAACLRSAGRQDEELKTWDMAAKYLPDTSRWRQTMEARKEEATNERDRSQWTALWQQIERTPIPSGAGFVYFHDWKIRLHLLMMGGSDLGAAQKAMDEFKEELGKYAKPTMEKSGSAAFALRPPEPSQPGYFDHFRFPDSGKEIVIPEDIMPPTAQGGVPAPLQNAIFAQKLESEEAILNFLWDRYEATSLTKQKVVRAQMDALVEHGPQPILIARESVPQEYWNGLPQQLELLLQGETDPRQIVAMIGGYHSSQEAERQNRERLVDLRATSVGDRASGPSSPTPDHFEQQRLTQEKMEAETYEMLHPKVPPGQSRIRFVPASAFSGSPFLIAPGIPNFPLPPTAQPTLQAANPEKGNP
jgi:hypothetical protein